MDAEAAAQLPSGLPGFDDLTGGLRGGDLVLVGSRPCMGKTSLVLNMAIHAALRSRASTVVVTPGFDHAAARMLAIEGRVSLDRLCAHRLTNGEWTKLRRALERMAEAPIHLLEGRRTDVASIESLSRGLSARIIFVDSMQSLGAADAEPLASTVRKLKQLAGRLRVPVVATTNLSRRPERRPRASRRPVLGDLEESAALEAAADLVLFVYRDEVYNENTRAKGEAELIVAKNRGGPTATLRLSFFGHHCRFAEPRRGL